MKKSYYVLFLFLLIFPLNFSFAQETTVAGQAGEWRRLESDNGEFSVEMPANHTYFYDRDGFVFERANGGFFHYAQMQMLNAAHGKTVMSVEIYKVRTPNGHLDNLLEWQRLKLSKIKDAPENFTVKQAEKSFVTSYDNSGEIPISFAARFITSKTHLYIVTVANRGATKTAEFERFLSSVRVGENQTGNTKISSLKALTLADIGEDLTNQPKAPEPPNQAKPSDLPKNPTRVLIVAKPPPPYTEEARKNFVSGTIRLRVTFDKNGGVSKIGLLSGLQHGLNRGAVFAALRIKFIPEEKDGVLVNATKAVEYSFRVG